MGGAGEEAEAEAVDDAEVTEEADDDGEAAEEALDAAEAAEEDEAKEEADEAGLVDEADGDADEETEEEETEEEAEDEAEGEAEDEAEEATEEETEEETEEDAARESIRLGSIAETMDRVRSLGFKLQAAVKPEQRLCGLTVRRLASGAQRFALNETQFRTRPTCKRSLAKLLQDTHCIGTYIHACMLVRRQPTGISIDRSHIARAFQPSKVESSYTSSQLRAQALAGLMRTLACVYNTINSPS